MLAHHHRTMLRTLASSRLALGRLACVAPSAPFAKTATAGLATSAVRRSYEDTIKNILVKKDSKVRRDKGKRCTGGAGRVDGGRGIGEMASA